MDNMPNSPSFPAVWYFVLIPITTNNTKGLQFGKNSTLKIFVAGGTRQKLNMQNILNNELKTNSNIFDLVLAK